MARHALRAHSQCFHWSLFWFTNQKMQRHWGICLVTVHLKNPPAQYDSMSAKWQPQKVSHICTATEQYHVLLWSLLCLSATEKPLTHSELSEGEQQKKGTRIPAEILDSLSWWLALYSKPTSLDENSFVATGCPNLRVSHPFLQRRLFILHLACVSPACARLWMGGGPRASLYSLFLAQDGNKQFLKIQKWRGIQF